MVAPCANGTSGDLRIKRQGSGPRSRFPSQSMKSHSEPTTPASGSSPKTPTCSLRRSGWATSSASIRATRGADAAVATRCELSAGPSCTFSSKSRIRRSRLAQSRSRSVDPSVDASSRMTNSKSSSDWPRMLSTAASRYGSALCTGMTTLTVGDGAVSICDSAVLLFCRGVKSAL